MRMTANILKIAFLLGIFTIIAATSASSTPKSYSQFYDPLPEFTSDAYEDHHRPDNSLKKHVLFVSIPLPGHVNPLLAQAAELADQGFTVTVATPDTLRDYILKVKDERVHYMPVGHCTDLASTSGQLFADCVKEPDFSVTAQMIFKWIHALHPCMAAGLTSLLSLSLLSLSQFPFPDAIVADITTTAAMEIADTFNIPFIANNADLAYVISTGVAGSNPVEPILFSGGSRWSTNAYLRPKWHTVHAERGSAAATHSLEMPPTGHMYPFSPSTVYNASSVGLPLVPSHSPVVSALLSSLSSSLLLRLANGVGRLLSPLIVQSIMTKPLLEERQIYAQYLPALKHHLTQHAKKAGKFEDIFTDIHALVSHLEEHIDAPLDVFNMLSNTVIIQNTIPGIEPPRSYPPNVHFVGPCMQKSQLPSQELLSLVNGNSSEQKNNAAAKNTQATDIPKDIQWLSPSTASTASAASLPAVYISMGTLARFSPAQTLAMVDAVARLASKNDENGKNRDVTSKKNEGGVRTLWKATVAEQDQIVCSAVRQCVLFESVGMQRGVSYVETQLQRRSAKIEDSESGVTAPVEGFYANPNQKGSLQCIPGKGYHRDGYAVVKGIESDARIRVLDCNAMFKDIIASENGHHLEASTKRQVSEMNIIPESMVLIMPWVSSQYALFTSGKIQVFISHCGINSIFEAAQAGKVAIFCIPMFGDQWDAAVRVRDSGIGSFLDKSVLASQGLQMLSENSSSTAGVFDSVSTLLRVVQNPVWIKRRQGITEFSRSYTGAPAAAQIVRFVTLYSQRGSPQVLHTEMGVPVVATYTTTRRDNVDNMNNRESDDQVNQGVLTADGDLRTNFNVKVIAGRQFLPPMPSGTRCGVWGASVHCLQMSPVLTWSEEYYGDVLIGVGILWILKRLLMFAIGQVTDFICCRRKKTVDPASNPESVKPKTD